LLGAQAAQFNAPVAVVAGFVGLVVALALLLRSTGRPTVDLADGAVAVLVLVAVWRLWPAAAPWPVFLDAEASCADLRAPA
jgi:uncharacterized membrane protein (UPF0136 family)